MFLRYFKIKKIFTGGAQVYRSDRRDRPLTYLGLTLLMALISKPDERKNKYGLI